MKNVLTRLGKLLPGMEIKKVIDAKKRVTVSVIKQDSKSGRRKDPHGCALARACVRCKMADAAVIGIGASYLVKDGVATRYETSEAIGREITSFDRHHDFAVGRDYVLGPISPSKKFGVKKTDKNSGPRKNSRPENAEVITRHRTTRIRVMKG